MLQSFRHALDGVGYAYATQRNLRVQTGIGALALALGVLVGLPIDSFAVLALTIGLVLTAEMINTAIEATVDLVTLERHPMAKIAKDVAAGAVTIAAITAVIIGAIMFLPRLVAIASFAFDR
ncbi:MAG: diacylglycerol kinase family protein [Dehalococcoidia bacterium]|nr:diacylglycerol kinase family protein [Dehalococcoidia bacterium]